MNEPLTYEDFKSQVEAAMPRDSPFRYAEGLEENEEFRTANENFQFKDMEIGKIYVFWNSRDTWFISLYSTTGKYYSVYWCFYRALSNSATRNRSIPIPMPDDESGGEDECYDWEGYVWDGPRWKELNATHPFKDALINWENLPWSDKQ